MKKLLILICFCIFAYGNEYTFKEVVLDELELQGISSEITFKSKTNRDLKMAQQWANLMKLNDYKTSNISDNRIYAIYTNQKKDSFNYFVGFKSKIENKELKKIKVNSSTYQNTVIDFNENSNMSDIWDNISSQKLKRDFKTDIEIYNVKDLSKKSYKIDIYLSSK